MEREIILRVAVPEDVGALLELQRQSPEVSQWPAADYSRLLELSSTFALVVESGGRIGADASPAGFLLGRVAADEMEILNLVVGSRWRRQGAARLLVGAALRQAAGRGARRCFLEVRASNQAALLFYQTQGFVELYRRPRYYLHPSEEAVICSRELPEAIRCLEGPGGVCYRACGV